MTKSAMVLLLAVGMISPQADAPDRGVLTRRYHEGEKLIYHMKAVNEGRRYEVQASGIVQSGADGKYFEEYAWSDFVYNGAAVVLPPASVQFRQRVSLDPGVPNAIPNLGQIHPRLIGPVTDFLTLYADLSLAIRAGKLAQAGDHFYYKHGTAASWADGKYVIVGEDSIDFDLTLADVDQSNRTATLVVRHVPPEHPQIKLPAAWMQEPVADTPNNWVQVARSEGKYVAGVGKETFEVRIKVDLLDGKILWGHIENPINAVERECTDAALTSCGNSKPLQILRQVELSLER